MAKINKDELTPEQLAEIEAKKAQQDAQSEGQNAATEENTGAATTEQTPVEPEIPKGKDKTAPAKTEPKGKACNHDFVFHASQTYKDRPGKKFVHRRCVKCNELKLFIEDVK